MNATTDVENYLATLPDRQRVALEALRVTIRAAAPDATEAISYQMPAFKQDGRPVVAYAAFKDHCSLFPMSAAVIDDLAKELEPFRRGKGTLRFQPDAPLPTRLVTRIIEARLAELSARNRR